MRGNRWIRKLGIAAAIVVAALLPHAVAAQAYPYKALRLIIPFPPGGSNDVVGRMVAAQLSARLGQPVVVENQGGAGGLIGAEMAAKAAPDGYTLLLVSVAYAFNPAIYKLPYEPATAFAPVAMLGAGPVVIAVTSSLPVASVKDLVALAKAKPGQLSYGSTGNGNMPNLAMESFKIAAGVNILHVPYKGAAPAVIDLLGGHVQATILDLPVLLPHVQGGKMRALAIATAKRAAPLPTVPTMAEAGYPSVNADNWYGIVVAAATPKDVVAKLHAALVTVLQSADTKQRFASQGANAVTSTPEELAAFMREETIKWGKVIKTSGIKIDQ